MPSVKLNQSLSTCNESFHTAGSKHPVHNSSSVKLNQSLSTCNESSCTTLLKYPVHDSSDQDRTVDSRTSDITVTSKGLGSSSAYTALIDLKIDIGISHLRKKEFKESDKCFRYALNLLKQIYGDHNMQVANVQEYLGDVAVEMGKHEEGDRFYICGKWCSGFLCAFLAFAA